MQLPEPLTPADCNLRGYRWMPLDVGRVIDSDLFGISTGDEFKVAFRLWAKSWSQVPAASLPDDDRLLAHLAGLSENMAKWKRVRAVALRGWIKCSDDRLYHPVIAEKALEAMGKREQHNDREDNEQSRQQRYRERRKALFETLREHGIVPSKDVKTDELERLIASLEPSPSVTKSVTGDVTANVTHDAPATAIEKDITGQDITNKGVVIVSSTSSRPLSDDFTPKDAGEWLRHFRAKHGFEADPTNVNDRKKLWPVFAGWVNAGLTTAFVDAAVASASALSREPIVCLPLYVDRFMANQQAARASPQVNARDESRRRAAEVLTTVTMSPSYEPPNGNVIDVNAKLLG
jgi:hypothetical protein